jgi:hypothetical protein
MPELGPERHLLRLRADATPYADDPPNAGTFYQAMGVYLVSWGRFETHFVADLCSITALTWDANPVHQIPLAWNQRSAIWKRAFRTLPELAPQRDAALALMTEILLRAKDRNVIVHSGWGAFLSADPLALECINLRSEGDEALIANLSIDVTRLERMLLEANTLNDRLAPITLFLGSLRPPPSDVQTILRPRESLLAPPRRPRRG